MESAEQALTITLPPQPIYLNADPTRLAQVVGNLLNNAHKYTDKGGRIELVVSVEWQVVSEEKQGAGAGSEALKLSTQHSPLATPFAVIRVRDNGIGIAASELARIFEMFVQIDTSLERSAGG
jgi:signal transduction histidine kinase